MDATSLSMSNLSLVAATSALNRARTAMNNAKGTGIKGMMKRARVRTSGIIAMMAASSAAIEGNLDFILGKDPRLVVAIEKKLESIFSLHGGVRLEPPLLRPSHHQTNDQLASALGPVELIVRRGTRVVLPEALHIPFARAVARGGLGASSLKRYSFSNVFHNGVSGGQPRENREASFDIVQHDSSISGTYLEAETLLVVAQSMMIVQQKTARSLKDDATIPVWYLKLTNTRLSDAILDICGIKGETLRSQCLHMISDLSVPSPSLLFDSIDGQRRKRSMSRGDSGLRSRAERLEEFLVEAKGHHGLSHSAAKKFRGFLRDCLPLPSSINEAIGILRDTMERMAMSNDHQDDARVLRRFEDATRFIRHLERLMSLLDAIGFSSRDYLSSSMSDCPVYRPLFLCLDLGMRQKRKQYHGGLFFQAIAIPSNPLSQDRDKIVNSFAVNGLKIVEGGRYDDMCRKFRPPGNFGDAVFDAHTQSTIPKCCGLKVSIGRLVELLYLETTLREIELTNAETAQGIDAIRSSLGHPLNDTPPPTQAIVASVHGLDNESVQHRFVVASRLWSEGVSCEYLAQSGVISSLLKQHREESQGVGTSDWNLEELCGVCVIMKVRSVLGGVVPFFGVS
jgi:histidyl-tRNA synthetase